jgi:hypothetical protein
MKTTEHMTLEQLESEVWPESEFSSHLVVICHQLRKKRLADFSIEDLRTMLSQSIGAKYLLPKAIEVLRKNPLAEGDFFEGDLLVAIARHPENINHLIPEDVEHLLAASVSTIETAGHELTSKNLSVIECLVAELRCVLRR